MIGRSGVEAIVHLRISLLKGYGKFEGDGLDAQRAGLVHADGPLGDIDMMRAPIGHSTAGILKPKTEIVVASLLNVLNLWRLAQPRLPVQLGR